MSHTVPDASNPSCSSKVRHVCLTHERKHIIHTITAQKQCMCTLDGGMVSISLCSYPTPRKREIILYFGEVIGFRLFRATGLAFAIRPKEYKAEILTARPTASILML